MPVISDKLKKYEKKEAAREKKRKEEEAKKQKEEQEKKEQEEKEAKEREEQEKRQKHLEKKAKRREKKTAAKKAKEELEKKANMRKEMALIRKCLPPKQVKDEVNIERQGLSIQRTEVKTGHHSKIYKAKMGDQENLVCKVIMQEKTPMPFRNNLPANLQIQRYIGGGATEQIKAAGMTDPKHPNLCKVIDVFLTEKKVYIFQEECDPKTIEHKMKKTETADENEVKNYMRQLAEVLKYLHSVGVANYNIKGSSMVCDKEGKLKLVGLDHCSFYWDPDMEQVIPKKKLNKKEWDKHNHMPPEAFTTDFDGSKADVWSWGLVMVQLITRENPFKIKLEQPFDEQWKTFAQTKTFSDEAKQLLDRIFTVDPQARPDMMDVCDDPYLKSGGVSPAPKPPAGEASKPPAEESPKDSPKAGPESEKPAGEAGKDTAEAAKPDQKAEESGKASDQKTGSEPKPAE